MAEVTLADFNATTDVDTDMEDAPKDTPKDNKGRRQKTKRKLNSPQNTQSLKRQNSLPDLSAKPTKLPQSFSELMINAFQNEKVIESLAPMLVRCINPVIETVMEKAADRAVEKVKSSILDSVKESTKELYETVNKQSEVIEAQKQLIENQQVTLQKNSDEIKMLKDEIKEIKSQLEGVKAQSNDIEQYGRRHSIRLSNFQCEEGKTEQENVDRIVNFVNNKLLTGCDKIDKTDIERCHPVGGKVTIVKFKSYFTKQKVFAAKKKLKGNPEKIFMTEDLTKFNHAIVAALVPLRKSKRVASFWTRNGTVYAKGAPEDRPVRVKSPTEVNALFG